MVAPHHLLADPHRHVLLLVVLLQVARHHLVHNLAKSAQHVAAATIVQVQHVKSLKAVKSAIHAGFVPLRKSATNPEFVHASSNQIFLMMSQVKS
jgi:hypothetical protein